MRPESSSGSFASRADPISRHLLIKSLKSVYMESHSLLFLDVPEHPAGALTVNGREKGGPKGERSPDFLIAISGFDQVPSGSAPGSSSISACCSPFTSLSNDDGFRAEIPVLRSNSLNDLSTYLAARYT